ncbi:hypothetical protein ACHAWF_008784 [Thalassiosira exigua]
MPAEVTEIAAVVSEKICDIFPSYARVARVLPDKNAVELDVAVDGTPVGLDVEGFWPEGCTLSAERKRAWFWQYHRAMGCHQCTAILAMVMKGLCDNGLPLVHNGAPVVDVLVLNTLRFDVSDLLSGKGLLRVHDPVTNTTVPVIASHEAMSRLHELGRDICYRLGMQLPDGDKDGRRNNMKKDFPETYVGTVPHWWVAVVTCNGGAYEMVHIDVCGAAYDPAALVSTGETFVSLKVFSTQEYDLVPNTDPGMEHKLIMLPNLSKRAAGEMNNLISLQPKSVRHFHCHHSEGAVEVTPLETYIERKPIDDAMVAKVRDLVQSIMRDEVKKLPVGSRVLICNIQSKPHLNGRNATIQDRAESGRIGVLIDRTKKPISVKTTCIQIPSQTPPYRTLEELRGLNDGQEEADAIHETLSQRQKSQIKRKLDLNDPAVNKVLLAIRSGQTGFTRLADPEYKRGVEALIQPPLNSLLPPEAVKNFRNGWVLSNHPKAGEAMAIINLFKATKQRLMTEHPECVLPNGAVMAIPGSELSRVQDSSVTKIRSDTELAFVFRRLDELGLFVNPAK